RELVHDGVDGAAAQPRAARELTARERERSEASCNLGRACAEAEARITRAHAGKERARERKPGALAELHVRAHAVAERELGQELIRELELRTRAHGVGLFLLFVAARRRRRGRRRWRRW